MLSGRSTKSLLVAVALLVTTPALGQDPNHLVRTNCIACHNEHTLQAGLNLQGFDAQRPERDPAVAEKIIRKLRSGQMPPREMSRDQAVIDHLVATLESGLEQNARALNRAGTRPFQRVNRAEYARLINDFLGLTVDPQEEVPEEIDHSGVPPVEVGGPYVYPIHAAAGAGYGQYFMAHAHRHVTDNWLNAVRFLVEECGADLNLRDANGNTPLHHAAARGDNELIHYLLDKGADISAVSRKGQTTADMANGPTQRVSPFPDTIALLESLGAINNHNCVSC